MAVEILPLHSLAVKSINTEDLSFFPASPEEDSTICWLDCCIQCNTNHMAQGIDLRHGPAPGLRGQVKIIRALRSGSFKPIILNLLKIALSRILMKNIKSIIRPQSLHYSSITNPCLRLCYRLYVYFPPKFIC